MSGYNMLWVQSLLTNCTGWFQWLTPFYAERDSSWASSISMYFHFCFFVFFLSDVVWMLLSDYFRPFLKTDWLVTRYCETWPKKGNVGSKDVWCRWIIFTREGWSKVTPPLKQTIMSTTVKSCWKRSHCYCICWILTKTCDISLRSKEIISTLENNGMTCLLEDLLLSVIPFSEVLPDGCRVLLMLKVFLYHTDGHSEKS